MRSFRISTSLFCFGIFFLMGCEVTVQRPSPSTISINSSPNETPKPTSTPSPTCKSFKAEASLYDSEMELIEGNVAMVYLQGDYCGENEDIILNLKGESVFYGDGSVPALFELKKPGVHTETFTIEAHSATDFRYLGTATTTLTVTVLPREPEWEEADLAPQPIEEIAIENIPTPSPSTYFHALPYFINMNGFFDKIGSTFRVRSGTPMGRFDHYFLGEYVVRGSVRLTDAGYSHIGFTLGYQPQLFGNPENAPLILVVLEGTPLSQSLSIYDGATNGKRLATIPVHGTEGSLVISVCNGRIRATLSTYRDQFTVETSVSPFRLEGWIGLRGGATYGGETSMSDIAIVDHE